MGELSSSSMPKLNHSVYETLPDDFNGHSGLLDYGVQIHVAF